MNWQHISVDDPVRVSDLDDAPLTAMPIGVKVNVFETPYPDLDFWREGERVAVLFSEPIMSWVQDDGDPKYWDADVDARRFVLALRDSLVVEAKRGLRLRVGRLNLSQRGNYIVEWITYFPATLSSRALITAAAEHFEEVWARAERCFLGLRGAVILGRDSGDALKTLKGIQNHLHELGISATIIKDKPDIAGEPVIGKVLRHALGSELVVVENSVASGHLFELAHLKMAGRPTAVFQIEGAGATWLTEDAYSDHGNWRKFCIHKAKSQDRRFCGTTLGRGPSTQGGSRAGDKNALGSVR